MKIGLTQRNLFLETRPLAVSWEYLKPRSEDHTPYEVEIRERRIERQETICISYRPTYNISVLYFKFKINNKTFLGISTSKICY